MNGTATTPMLVVEHVDKSFPIVFGSTALFKYLGRPPRRQVLFDINLTVERGELFGLLGPNGAGKTTLLKLLATLTTPDGGSMTIDGVDVSRDPFEAKRRIGLCTSEERSFYFRLTARENLEFFGALVGLHGANLRRRIDEVIDLVDLRSSLDGRFGGFSSGMRQRMTVARALLGDPDVLFLDEPTRAVDPVHAEDLRVLIRRDLIERAGKTVVLATNLLDEAWQICDRVAVVSHGRITALGRPQELSTRLERLVRYYARLDRVDESLLVRTRAVAGLRDIVVTDLPDGVALELAFDRSTHSLNELVLALGGNGAHLYDFRPIDVAPVDVFKEATSGRHA